MQIIQQLLKNTPFQAIQGYKSHLRLHLKEIMTQINKSKLQDLTKVEIRKNKCIESCYKKMLNQFNSNHKQTQKDQGELLIGVQELKECKKNCKNEQKAVRKHLDDINFYSKRKFTGCSGKCEKKYEDFILSNSIQTPTNSQNQPSKQYMKEKQLNQPYNQCMWDCYNRLDRRYKIYWKQQQDEIINGYI